MQASMSIVALPSDTFASASLTRPPIQGHLISSLNYFITALSPGQKIFNWNYFDRDYFKPQNECRRTMDVSSWMCMLSAEGRKHESFRVRTWLFRLSFVCNLSDQAKRFRCTETLIRRVRLLTQRTGLQISHPAVFPKGFAHKPEHNSL